MRRICIFPFCIRRRIRPILSNFFAFSSDIPMDSIGIFNALPTCCTTKVVSIVVCWDEGTSASPTKICSSPIKLRIPFSTNILRAFSRILIRLDNLISSAPNLIPKNIDRTSSWSLSSAITCSWLSISLKTLPLSQDWSISSPLSAIRRSQEISIRRPNQC